MSTEGDSRTPRIRFRPDFRMTVIGAVVVGGLGLAYGSPVVEALQGAAVAALFLGGWELFSARHPIAASRLFGAAAPHYVQPPPLRGWLGSPRVFFSFFGLGVVAAPLALAARALTDSEPVPADLYELLARVWLIGLALGLAIDLAYASRGRLIIRDPVAILENALNIKPFVLTLALCFVASLVLMATMPASVDWQVSTGLFCAGLLAAMWPVALYISFRLRPDELVSPDRAKARAALRRLGGDRPPPT